MLSDLPKCHKASKLKGWDLAPVTTLLTLCYIASSLLLCNIFDLRLKGANTAVTPRTVIYYARPLTLFKSNPKKQGQMRAI